MTDPAATPTTNDGNPRTYCCKIVGLHDMREAGESRWAPWTALFATRLLTGFICITFLTLSALKFYFVRSVVTLATLGFSSLTFLALSICTYLQGTGARASRKSGLSSVVVFLHFITAALSMFIISEFVALIVNRGFHPQYLVLVLPLAFYLLDVIVMRSRIRLRYRYALFFTIVSTLYNVIGLLVVVFVLCPSCIGGGSIGIAVLISLALALFSSLLAVWVTRMSCPCLKKSS